MSESNVKDNMKAALQAGPTQDQAAATLSDGASVIANALRQGPVTEATPPSTDSTETEVPSTDAETETEVQSTNEPVEAEEATGEEGEETEVEGVELSDDSESEETPAETEEVEATSEDESEEASDEPWFVTANSIYKSAEEGKKGLEEKDRYINVIQGERDKLAEDLNSAVALNQFYSENVTEEQITAALVQAKLPEEYQGRSEDDYEGDDLRNYVRLVARAEAEVERDKNAQKQKTVEARNAKQERAQKARSYVDSTATLSFFGVTKPEERMKVTEALDTRPEDGGYTEREKAVLITEVFGEETGLMFLEGVRTRLGGPSKTESKPAAKPKAAAKKAPVEKKVVEKVSKAKVKSTPSPEAPKTNQARTGPPEDTLRRAFAGMQQIQV